ncbi:MAG: hypothetical protein EKK31_04180 [Hyphomicrobiales bacterium]|nr:MAG: hypothetical protein EKK31_04180 [Hyphomicrobiales bacterium]
MFGSGLLARHRRIHAADRESDTRLQRMIGAAVSGALEGAFVVEPEVIARDRSFWLLAEIVPMTSFVRDLFNGGDLLLCFTGLVGNGRHRHGYLDRHFSSRQPKRG